MFKLDKPLLRNPKFGTKLLKKLLSLMKQDVNSKLDNFKMCPTLLPSSSQSKGLKINYCRDSFKILKQSSK